MTETLASAVAGRGERLAELKGAVDRAGEETGTRGEGLAALERAGEALRDTADRMQTRVDELGAALNGADSAVGQRGTGLDGLRSTLGDAGELAARTVDSIRERLVRDGYL